MFTVSVYISLSPIDIITVLDDSANDNGSFHRLFPRSVLFQFRVDSCYNYCSTIVHVSFDSILYTSVTIIIPFSFHHLSSFLSDLILVFPGSRSLNIENHVKLYLYSNKPSPQLNDLEIGGMVNGRFDRKSY